MFKFYKLCNKESQQIYLLLGTKILNVLLIAKNVKNREIFNSLQKSGNIKKKNYFSMFQLSIYLLALVLKKEFTWSWLLIHFRQWQSNSSYQNDPCKKRKCLDVGWSPTRIWMYRHVRYRCILIANAQVGYEYCIFHPFFCKLSKNSEFQTFLFCFDFWPKNWEESWVKIYRKVPRIFQL